MTEHIERFTTYLASPRRLKDLEFGRHGTLAEAIAAGLSGGPGRDPGGVA